MNVEFKSPVDVQIEITERCNHHCRHCYNTYSNTDTCKKMDLTISDIDIIANSLIENDILSVTLTGGEPFLNFPVLLWAIEFFYTKGIYVSINTNLTYLPEKAILSLKKFPRIKILTTLFSYNKNTHDYICGDAGGYNKTVSNIKRLVEEGVHVSVNMVLCQENIKDIYLTGKMCAELGCDAFCCTRVSAPLWNKEYRSSINNAQLRESIDVLLAVKQDFGIDIDVLGCYPKCAILGASSHSFFGRRCMAGKTTVTISSNCGVRPCSHSSTEYGNLKNSSLTEIWEKMSDWRDDLYVPEKCKACKLFRLCSGGCRVDAEARGDINAMDINAEPEAVVRYHPPVTPKNTQPQIMNDQVFFLNPEITFRAESFGGLLHIRNTMNIIIINQAAFNYLMNRSKEESITFSQFLNDSGAKNENEILFVKKLFQKLVRKKFLIERK